MTAVGIDDDLASGEAGVAVGAADNEFAGGVYIELESAVEQMLKLCGELGTCAGNEDSLDVARDGVEHTAVGCFLREVFAGKDKLVVLGRDNDCIYAHGAMVLVIFDSHLTFRVGTEISHIHTLATYLGESHHERVAQGERKGYVEVGLVCGVAEHHALVAGALLEGFLALNTTVDIGALLMHGQKDTARIAVEAELAAVVANFVDNAACGLLHVDIGVALDFTGNHDLTGGHQCFTCHFRLRVAGKKFVKDGVADLIGHFIGMAFRNRF